MRIDWKLVTYCMIFIAGVASGEHHDMLCLLFLLIAWVSNWYIKNGRLSMDYDDE